MWIGIDDVLRFRPRQRHRQPLRTGPGHRNRSRQSHTYADFDVMMPSTDGTTIVFLQNGYLHVMDIASRKITRIAVTDPQRPLGDPDTDHRREGLSPCCRSRQTTAKRCSGSPRRSLHASARKETLRESLHVHPAPGKCTLRLRPTARPIAFFSDRTGEYQLYLQPVDGGEWTAADDVPRPDRLPAPLVSGRQEDPLRQQGLRAVRAGCRSKDTHKDR